MQQPQPETTTNKAANINVNFLPSNSDQAVQTLIKTSQKLLDLADRETQSLLQNDVLSFGVIQDEKDPIVEQYVAMSGEFRNRLPEFRRTNKTMLRKLEGLQKELGEKSKANNIIVEKLKAKSAKNTQNNLYTVQELAQIKPVRLPNDDTQENKGA